MMKDCTDGSGRHAARASCKMKEKRLKDEAARSKGKGESKVKADHEG